MLTALAPFAPRQNHAAEERAPVSAGPSSHSGDDKPRCARRGRGLRRLFGAPVCALAAALTALIAATPPSQSGAQSLFSAAVKVNDAVVTGYDIEQKARLIRLGDARVQPSVALRRARDELVGHHLKLQEAERVGLTISDAQIDEAIANIAGRNKQSVDALLQDLSRAGVEQSTFREQLKSELAWNELVRRRFGSRVAPSEAEIDAELAMLKGRGDTRYDLRQIVIPVRSDAARDVVQRGFEEAERVRRELTSCAKVAELAPRYAQNSGDAGRRTASQMPPPIRAAITQLAVGATTTPMRGGDGFYVFMLCDKITPQAASRSDIYDRLLQQNAARFTESYLDDLRRMAMIETP